MSFRRHYYYHRLHCISSSSHHHQFFLKTTICTQHTAFQLALNKTLHFIQCSRQFLLLIHPERKEWINPCSWYGVLLLHEASLSPKQVVCCASPIINFARQIMSCNNREWKSKSEWERKTDGYNLLYYFK